MNIEDALIGIRNICLANHMELQEIKKKLNMPACEANYLQDYELSIPQYIEDMTNKIGHIVAHSKSFNC
jgi:hypothetical protein